MEFYVKVEPGLKALWNKFERENETVFFVILFFRFSLTKWGICALQSTHPLNKSMYEKSSC